MSSENVVNACWSSDGQSIGEPFTINTTHSPYSGNEVWVYPNSNVYPNPFDPNSPYVPYVPPPSPNTAPWVPSPSTPPFTFPFPSTPPVEDKDAQGNRVVKSPPPSLELILVEIAKVLKEGGDILQIREIFERHKLKLIDHDGEIIFDPRDIEKLENKGF